MFLGTFLAMCVSVVWVFALNHWQQVNASDPRKILAQEVVTTVKARVPWPMRNGGTAGRGEKRILGWLSRRSSADGSEKR